MKKLAIIISLLGMFNQIITAQYWEQILDIGGTENVSEVKQLSDGNFAIAGWNTDSIGFLSKIDASGDLLFTTNFNANSFVSFRETADAGFIYGGTYFDSNAGVEMSYFVKTDVLGNTEWSDSYLANGLHIMDVLVLSDGNYLTYSAGRFDIQLKKYNNSGVEIWTKSHTITGNLGWVASFAEFSIIETLDMGFAITTNEQEFIFESGASSGRLVKLDASGELEWEQTINTSQICVVLDLAQRSDGGYAITMIEDDDPVFGQLPSQIKLGLFSSAGVQEGGITLDGDAEFLNVLDVSIPSPQVLIDANDEYIVCYPSDDDMGDLGIKLTKYASDGSVLFDQKYGQPFLEEYGSHFDFTQDGGFIIAGRQINNLVQDVILIKVDGDGNLPRNTINGNVFFDESGDCLLDGTEEGQENWFIHLTGNNLDYYLRSDESGDFSVNVGLGNYNLEIVDESLMWEVHCSENYPISFIDYDNTETVNMGVQPEFYCPLLYVDIGAPFLQLCFESDYTVSYCNQGTALAENAYIEVVLDEGLIFNSSTIPNLDLGDNIYRFDIGNLAIGDCGTFDVNVTVDCDGTLGETLCTEANIFPDSLCIPIDPAWDMSSIVLEAICSNDSILFNIENIGIGNMADSLNYLVIEDNLMGFQGKFKLDAGQSYSFGMPSNGITYRLEADQAPFHPGFSMPSVAVEGCGIDPLTGLFSLGFLNQFTLDESNPFQAKDCQPNVGSFDPNDKQGFPLGREAAHYIEANTDLEYKIRFQNTGTAPAVNIVVLDTISPHMDIATLELGAYSHPYKLELRPNNVLAFVFENIMLPDSTNNEPESHGFIQFRMKQEANLPIGTVIENSAAIYFDFNEPVITNIAFHQIAEPLGETTVSIFEVEKPVESLSIYPNPFLTETKIVVETEEKKAFDVRIFNAIGQVQYQGKTNAQGELILQRENIPQGIYFIEILDQNQRIANGKIIAN